MVFITFSVIVCAIWKSQYIDTELNTDYFDIFFKGNGLLLKKKMKKKVENIDKNLEKKYHNIKNYFT